MATNIMAKHAQSSSQLTVPHVRMRPIWVHPRRTAVIQSMIRSTCAAESPRGRPKSETKALMVAFTTKRSGRS